MRSPARRDGSTTPTSGRGTASSSTSTPFAGFESGSTQVAIYCFGSPRLPELLTGIARGNGTRSFAPSDIGPRSRCSTSHDGRAGRCLAGTGDRRPAHSSARLPVPSRRLPPRPDPAGAMSPSNAPRGEWCDGPLASCDKVWIPTSGCLDRRMTAGTRHPTSHHLPMPSTRPGGVRDQPHPRLRGRLDASVPGPRVPARREDAPRSLTRAVTFDRPDGSRG
jgi:hypothetical protein